MITGPGSAATTRTSTPKSFSFFSIIREVISSVSDATDSTRPGAASSRSTCGSLVSASSLKSGFWRSLTTRALFGTSSTGASITIGRWSSCSWCSTSTSSSRSRSARSPRRMSSARSMRSTRRVRSDSMLSPIRSARRSHEKRSDSEMPATSAAIQNTPEPAKPSSFMLVVPST